MKAIVRYTLYFIYEDSWFDKDPANKDSFKYFIEEHNCHGNFINLIQKSMELAEDDICNAGITEIVSPYQVPKDISPYMITIKRGNKK